MRLATRVEKLMERRALHAACPVCGDGGPRVVTVVLPPAVARLDDIPRDHARRDEDFCTACGARRKLRLCPPPAPRDTSHAMR